jgi:hypothetical protein
MNLDNDNRITKRFIKVNDRVVGTITNGTFSRWVWGSKHLLKYPKPAWSINAKVFHEEIEPCCEEIGIIDKKSGTVYRVSVEDFKRLSFQTQGDNCEWQLALTLEHWHVEGIEADVN